MESWSLRTLRGRFAGYPIELVAYIVYKAWGKYTSLHEYDIERYYEGDHKKLEALLGLQKLSEMKNFKKVKTI